MTLSLWEAAARTFEPPLRRWTTPGALALALDPNTVQTPALDLIDAELVNLIDDPETDRLAVFMAPQEGKSVRVSRRFVEWVLSERPDWRVAIVSYADEMSRRHGSDIKLDAQTYNGDDGTADLGIRLRDDSRSAGRWQIEGHTGGVYCVGIGGALTGKPVDLLVIDDPLKDLEQAQSEVYRERCMRFWRAVAVPRLGPGAKVVLIQTRWDERDMGGQLLTEEPDRWRVVSIPAIAESQDDPLGREPGQAMVSARGDRDWDAIRRSVGEYVWAALYQQRPAPAEGNLFKRANFRYWTACPRAAVNLPAISCDDRTVYIDTLWRFLTVDLAASTRTSADYTVAAVWGITADGDLVLLDGLRAHLAPADHWAPIKALRAKWDAGTVFVEPAGFGTTFVYEASRDGVPITELKPDKDKLTRALPAAARLDAGRLWVPSLAEAPWVQTWIDELAVFDHGAHDDVVDVFGYAARVAAAHWLPPEPASVTEPRRMAALTADPNEPAEYDLMSMPM
jgi:predicted phage terminase large subunit-like protein